MKHSREGACRRGVITLVLIALLAASGLAACDSSEQERAPSPATASPVSVAEVQAAFDEAARAVSGRNAAGYREAIRAADQSSRDSLDEVYRRLSQIRWASFSFVVNPLPADPQRFSVEAAGRVRGVGPSDRLAGFRIYELQRRGGQLVVTADGTPEDARRQYLLAFSHPIVVRGEGVVVVAERGSRQRARALAAVGGQARAKVERTLGVDARDAVLVTIYSSAQQMRAAQGGGPSEERIKFFSNVTPRLASEPWRMRDVGVVGPMLDGTGEWMPRMLAHEFTHAYTARWFARTTHAPPLLLEGLATAVEGGHEYALLREEIRTGNHVWPLDEALATGSLWMGNSTEDVHLAYLEGSSLVRYVIDKWGLPQLEPFFVALADSDLTSEGLDDVTRDVLGVSWAKFSRGWKAYVSTRL